MLTNYFIWILALNVVTDFYFFYKTKFFVKSFFKRIHFFVFVFFTVFGNVVLLFWKHYADAKVLSPPFFRIVLSSIVISYVFSKTIALFWLLLADIIKGFKVLKNVFFGVKKTNVSRRLFLERAALASFSIAFGGFIFGLLKGAFKFRIVKKEIAFPTLPKAFDGIRIVQISDLHAGSFFTTDYVQEIVNQINQLQPDMIVFTGDLVNQIAEEALPFIPILSQLHAPLGKFSILGNHDYGNYFYDIDDKVSKAKDRALMIEIHQKMGFKLLLNDYVIVEKSGEQFALLGVENWGKLERFPRIGNIEKTISKLPQVSFQLLLSHDPSHWNEIIKQNFPQINLTLSGHTHGLQFGVDLSDKIRWSPATMLYPQWADLYQENGQYLYVNRGLAGTFNARLGMWPEITALTLRTK